MSKRTFTDAFNNTDTTTNTRPLKRIRLTFKAAERKRSFKKAFGVEMDSKMVSKKAKVIRTPIYVKSTKKDAPPAIVPKSKSKSMTHLILDGSESGSLVKALFQTTPKKPERLACELPQDVIDSNDMGKFLGCMPIGVLELLSTQNFQIQMGESCETIKKECQPIDNQTAVAFFGENEIGNLYTVPTKKNQNIVHKIIKTKCCNRCKKTISGAYTSQMINSTDYYDYSSMETIEMYREKLGRICMCNGLNEAIEDSINCNLELLQNRNELSLAMILAWDDFFLDMA